VSKTAPPSTDILRAKKRQLATVGEDQELVIRVRMGDCFSLSCPPPFSTFLPRLNVLVPLSRSTQVDWSATCTPNKSAKGS